MVLLLRIDIWNSISNELKMRDKDIKEAFNVKYVRMK